MTAGCCARMGCLCGQSSTIGSSRSILDHARIVGHWGTDSMSSGSPIKYRRRIFSHRENFTCNRVAECRSSKSFREPASSIKHQASSMSQSSKHFIMQMEILLGEIMVQGKSQPRNSALITGQHPCSPVPRQLLFPPSPHASEGRKDEEKKVVTSV